MKNKNILDENELTEQAEPLTPDELIMNLLQDLLTDNPPEEIASEFIENFVLIERDESNAVLAMIDTPTETLVEMLKHVVSQGYETQISALNVRGFSFIEGLKLSVSRQLTELANDTASNQ